MRVCFKHRNKFPVDWSLALCERYLGHALRSIAGLPVVCTRYETLLETPEQWVKQVSEHLVKFTSPCRPPISRRCIGSLNPTFDIVIIQTPT